MHRFIITGLVVMLAGSVATLAWLVARPADPRLAAAATELQAAHKEIAQLKAELARRPLESKATSVAKAKVDTPPQQPAAPLPSAPQATAGAQAKPATAGFREMFANPGMRSMMEQQQAVQVELSYAKLFGYLNLSDEEKAHFKKLLVERETAQMDIGLKMMDNKLTPEQRKQVAAQFQEQKKAFDAAIKTFLNDDSDWTTFEHWEDTKPERTQFDMMGRSVFEATGEPLSAQQEQQLIDTMVRVRKEPTDVPRFNDPATFDPSQLTDEMIQRQLKHLDANAQKIEQAARGFLSPVQLQALTKMNEQMRNMSEMGIKMSEMMMKGGGN